ncbi:mCG145059, isoform CRA_a, partial [Mus musculus]
TDFGFVRQSQCQSMLCFEEDSALPVKGQATPGQCSEVYHVPSAQCFKHPLVCLALSPQGTDYTFLKLVKVVKRGLISSWENKEVFFIFFPSICVSFLALADEE